ncbi:hypothetical protein [Bifidobacterium miconisargentati]|uniref:hypothetical protein n=1 Tax=Bifidobacterium miconisargentati TaxID=2834437 RepID=UPI001F2D3422|nr:hypothetical protein [Bifidobacterium miconisargentati]
MKCGTRLVFGDMSMVGASPLGRPQPYGMTSAGSQYAPIAPPKQFIPKGYIRNERDNGLRFGACIANVVFSVGYAFIGLGSLAEFNPMGLLFLICLSWMIPMTLHSWSMYQGEKPNTTTFAVCDLIFVNIVSGILLLISSKDE